MPGEVVLSASSLERFAVQHATECLKRSHQIAAGKSWASATCGWGTTAGSVAAGGGAVALVSAAGVPGLSAAGITSGLAAIGSSVGGGMAAGAFVVIAAPAAIGALVGWGLYRLLSRRQ